MTEIVENMKKHGMHVEAVDIVYTFGIEDKFSPHKILISFLRESKDAWKRTKRDAPVLLVLVYFLVYCNIFIFIYILINGGFL